MWNDRHMKTEKPMRTVLAEKARLWMSRVPEANTQAKLAARSGMSQSSIHRVVMETTEPLLETAHKLSRAFGVSLARFLDDEDREDVGLPFDMADYARLPAEGKQQIKEFAEFVMAKHRLANEHLPTHEANIAATDDDAAIVSKVARRNLTTNASSQHESNTSKDQLAPHKRTRDTRN